MLKRSFLQSFQVVEEIKVVTYIAGEGDISTDLLSPEKTHSRSDRELHGKCLISQLHKTKSNTSATSDKSVMLIAEKELWA
jgi:aconitate hydratase 2/2-methylisocitrate dehydratase